ncbi:MAG: IS110 family transposase [Schwartzia succinivorans]|nr:IS110 family transposase [Schwartzia succinivorans]
MTAVGVDVSKGKSVVAIRRPGGEVVRMPFEVQHDISGLRELVRILKQTDGDIRIVMEHTGVYWYPVARALNDAGFFVSVVNAILIHDFSDNSLRKVKTDRADAMKIANYALSFWDSLRRFTPDDEIRVLLKAQSRLYERTSHVSIVLRNGLVTLTEQTFPGINKLIPSTNRTAVGHYKWVDFCKRFWHRDCVAGISLKAFSEAYCSWCKREGYIYSVADAEKIHRTARETAAVLTKCESTRRLVIQSVDTLNATYDSLQSIRTEMNRLASMLPEYNTVMNIYGVGPITGPWLIAEIGDVRRFKNKSALVAFAGFDAPPFQSGTFELKSRHISKKGSPHLRQAAFLTCSAILRQSNPEDPIYAFMDKKRSEGKHFYVYLVAGAAKLLRIYYARVSACFFEEETLAETS